MDAGEGVVDGGVSASGFAFGEAIAEGEVEEIEFSIGCGLSEIVAEVLCGAAPESGEFGVAPRVKSCR